MSGWFTGGKPTEREQRRNDERQLRTANRELASDLRQLEQKEKELTAQIKSLAKAGQKDACALLAKQLVQLRKQKVKNVNVAAQISSIASQGKQMHSAGAMTKALASTAQTMKAVDQQLPMSQFSATMRDFTQAQDRMDMRSEVMDDTFDNLFEVNEAEESAVIDQVLDEIGIDTKVKLSNIPSVRDPLAAESVKEDGGKIASAIRRADATN